MFKDIIIESCIPDVTWDMAICDFRSNDKYEPQKSNKRLSFYPSELMSY
jgi:hypothetical protein